MSDIPYKQSDLVVYVTDETNGNATVVKAASTAALSTDASLVIAISPNSPLPSGANAIGSVTANIGTTNGLALDATVAKLTVAQGASLGSNTQVLTGASVTTSAPTYTTGQVSPASLNTSGQLRVEDQGIDIVASGIITTLNGSVTFATRSMESALIQLSGSWVASVQLQGLSPDGVTWNNLTAAGVPSGPTFTSSAITVNGTYRIVSASAYSQLRATATAYTSGTITVNATVSDKPAIITSVQLTAANFNAQVVGSVASGSAVSVNPVIIGGKDDSGNAIIQDGSLVLTKHALWVHTLPGEADFTDDGVYYNSVVEFTLPTNGTESAFFFLKNPSGSGKKLFIDDVQCDIVTKGQEALFRMYVNPTSSANGTAATISSSYIGGGTAASSATAFTGPTVSANGTKFRVFSVGKDAGSTDVSFNFGLEIAANNTILFTGTPSANNVIVAISIRWAETA